MIVCESCGRHHKVNDTTCPFCAKRSSPAWRAVQLAAGVVTTAVLTACYGTSGFNDTGDTNTLTDADGDGVEAPEDCDDDNAAVNPSAIEICDNEIDDDCDEATDAEDTDCATE